MTNPDLLCKIAEMSRRAYGASNAAEAVAIFSNHGGAPSVGSFFKGRI